jgi:hypothetical protein
MLSFFYWCHLGGAVWTESNVFAAIWYNSIVRKTGGLKDGLILEITATESHDQSSVGDICYSIQGQSTCIRITFIQCNTGNTDHSWEKSMSRI